MNSAIRSRGVASLTSASPTRTALAPWAGVVPDVLDVAHAGFGHHERAGGNAAGQRREDGTVDVERLEVADVDADDPGVRGHGALDFLGRVRLDQHVHAELAAEGA